MSLNLDRIDSAPITNSTFPAEFLQWIWVLIDSLNENIADIEGAALSTTVIQPSTLAFTQTVEVNSLYIPTNTLVTTFQLPVMCVPGNRVTIAGQGSGGWIMLTGAGQTIQIADVGATATTSVASSSRYDSIELVCVLENTTWITLSTQTTGFVIV
jgi:hypothetical protein